MCVAPELFTGGNIYCRTIRNHKICYLGNTSTLILICSYFLRTPCDMCIYRNIYLDCVWNSRACHHLLTPSSISHHPGVQQFRLPTPSSLTSVTYLTSFYVFNINAHLLLKEHYVNVEFMIYNLCTMVYN